MVASYIFELEIFFLSSLSEEKMSKRGCERRKEKGREKEEDNNTLYTEVCQDIAAIYVILGISQIIGMIMWGCRKITSWNKQSNFSFPNPISCIQPLLPYTNLVLLKLWSVSGFHSSFLLWIFHPANVSVPRLGRSDHTMLGYRPQQLTHSSSNLEGKGQKPL